MRPKYWYVIGIILSVILEIYLFLSSYFLSKQLERVMADPASTGGAASLATLIVFPPELPTIILYLVVGFVIGAIIGGIVDLIRYIIERKHNSLPPETNPPKQQPRI